MKIQKLSVKTIKNASYKLYKAFYVIPQGLTAGFGKPWKIYLEA